TISASALICFAAAIASNVTLRSSPSLVSPITIIFSLMSFYVLSSLRFIVLLLRFFVRILILALDLVLLLLAFHLPLFPSIYRFLLFLFFVPIHLHPGHDHLFLILHSVSFSPSLYQSEMDILARLIHFDI